MSKYKYIVFNKPYGILSQFTSDNPKETLSEFNLPKNVYAAGRLDKDSEGLLILTDDGPFIKELADPKSMKEKTYWVQVENIPDENNLLKLQNGLKIEDYITKKCRAKILDPQPDIAPRVPPIRERKSIPTIWLEIVLTEGKNRQVRKMTAAIGHPTLRLIRVQIGKIKLHQINSGEYIEVNKKDILD